MNLPPLEPRSSWRPPRISDLPNWADARRVGFDIETRDPNLTEMGPGMFRKDGYIAGFSFALEDGDSYYVPVRHEGGDNVPNPEQAWAYLRDQAATFGGEIVGLNLSYDMGWVQEEQGVVFSAAKSFLDVGNADVILYELHDHYNLDAVCTRHGIPGKNMDQLLAAAAAWGVDPKSQMWRLPGRHVAEYAIADVTQPLLALRRIERQLERDGLWHIWELETQLLPVLVAMRRRGVRVDLDRVDQIDAWALGKEVEALGEITRLTGIALAPDDTTKTASIAPVLRHLGIEVPKTDEGNDSVTNDWLDTVDHPTADLIKTAKKFNKLRGTFCNSIRHHNVGGRVHCTFRQLRGHREGRDDEAGARYGRLSCSDPNMQQQPARDEEIGPMWRSIYLPDEGAQWASLDFSQQEPRWLVHFAEGSALRRGKNPWPEQARDAAIRAAEQYRNDPTTDNHQMTADMCGIPRKPAKIINLGLTYGMGGAKLCRKLGLPTQMMVKFHGEWIPLESKEGKDAVRKPGARVFEVAGEEGKALLDKYHAGVPFVRELERRCQKAAESRGYVVTVEGRRCRFPRRRDRRGWDWCHKALNRIIQGSSGDQTKRAMIVAHREGIPMQLQVHDELDLSWTERSVLEQLAEIMAHSTECRVPHKVDIETGPNWGAIE